MAAFYLVFSYLRPQAIYPALDLLPWTQLTMVLGVVYLVVKKQLKIQAVHIMLATFFLIIFLSSIFSTYPDISMNKLDVGYIWLLEVLFFTNCIKNLHQFKLIIILFFIILFKMSLHGAKTWAFRGFAFTKWGLAGPSGFFANSGEFSLLMAILAVLSLAFLLSHKEKINKLYYLLPITAIMSVLGSSSRGGQLAMVVGLSIVLVVVAKIKFKNICIVLIAGYIGFSLLPEQQKERFYSMGEDSTSQNRLEYWSAGLDMMQRHPILGVGHYGFSEYYSDYYAPYQITSRNSFYANRKEVSHNSFIEVGSTLGYTGLVCYLGIIILFFHQNRMVRALLKGREVVQQSWVHGFSIGIGASMAVYIVGSLFMSVAFYPYIYLLLMFSQIFLNSANKIVSENQ